MSEFGEYTNKGLVAYCSYALKLHTRYMWGGIMRQINTGYIERLAKQYPTHYSSARQMNLRNFAAANHPAYGCDCVGLIKSYYWGGVGSPHYSAKTDVDASLMYSRSRERGTNIANMPEIPGLAVYMPGHIGVYVGGGKVIECTKSSYGDGVVMTPLVGRGWTKWSKIPYITYVEEKEAEKLTDKEIFEAVQRHLATLVVPEWAKQELEEAKQEGITDGTNPMQFVPRYQAAIMALRAKKKK